jgi:hypothetical protein
VYTSKRQLWTREAFSPKRHLANRDPNLPWSITRLHHVALATQVHNDSNGSSKQTATTVTMKLISDSVRWLHHGCDNIASVLRRGRSQSLNGSRKLSSKMFINTPMFQSRTPYVGQGDSIATVTISLGDAGSLEWRNGGCGAVHVALVIISGRIPPSSRQSSATPVLVVRPIIRLETLPA